jgi:hypothetical protein
VSRICSKQAMVPMLLGIAVGLYFRSSIVRAAKDLFNKYNKRLGDSAPDPDDQIADVIKSALPSLERARDLSIS